uniref:Uncharacterized protein n=1 Tax=Globodera pallida TaxID=36090 RepID=A0A183C279_GLOPA
MEKGCRAGMSISAQRTTRNNNSNNIISNYPANYTFTTGCISSSFLDHHHLPPFGNSVIANHHNDQVGPFGNACQPQRAESSPQAASVPWNRTRSRYVNSHPATVGVCSGLSFHQQLNRQWAIAEHAAQPDQLATVNDRVEQQLEDIPEEDDEEF